jgi:glutathione synthase/RimK-type ligase-like ATP-grasp enzyme
VGQHALLRSHGFEVPTTAAVFGHEGLAEKAREFATPFIVKHNQGGKGLGVRRFDSHDAFDLYVDSEAFEEPIDGITLIQEYVQAREPFITRAEFVGGEFVYAVRVDTSGGSFELCPADACVVPGSVLVENGEVCLIDGPSELFTLRRDITAQHPLIKRLAALLAESGVEIAGIEFIETVDGRTVVYDINTNTNYNPGVEVSSPISAPRQIARYLGQLLEPERSAQLQRA